MSQITNKKFLQIHPDDNVLVALQDLHKGELIEWNNDMIVLQDEVNAKHKFFIHDMAVDEEVLMYGVLVGKATVAIPKGGRMTTENIYHASQDYAYRNVNYKWQAPDVSAYSGRTFNGYHREDGKVGTANYWLFIPTVFCENRNMDVIKEALHNNLGYTVTDKYKQFTRQLLHAYEQGESITSFHPDHLGVVNPAANRVFKNVDGIKFLNHQGGCGGTRQDSQVLSNLLVSYADHPNVAGITILSLGCQHLQTADFLHDLLLRNPNFKKKGSGI